MRGKHSLPVPEACRWYLKEPRAVPDVAVGDSILQSTLLPPSASGFVWDSESPWHFSYFSLWWGHGEAGRLIRQMLAWESVCPYTWPGIQAWWKPTKQNGGCSASLCDLVRISLSTCIRVITAALGDMEMGKKALRPSPCPLPKPLHAESFSPGNQPHSWFPYLGISCSLPLEYAPASPISDGDPPEYLKPSSRNPLPPHRGLFASLFNSSSNILLLMLYRAILNCTFASLSSLQEWALWEKELQTISFLILSIYQMAFT